MFTTQSSLEYIGTALLIPYARNSRTHSPEQIRQVANSITEFGFTNPVLVDVGNGIIAGHGRVMAAQSLGMDKVPCIRLSHLTEAQKKAYIIADNQLALNSGWDEDMLRDELIGLQGVDFDLDLIGFDADFLDGLLKTAEEEQSKPADSGIVYQEKYACVVECKDATEQESIYNRLKEMGYTVKVLVN